ncbi:MAG: P-loop NTPase [Armatimonadota bacterium]
MGIKIAISGKGGVGKSTVAGTLARLYAQDGASVLAIDADPDANLASAIGMPTSSRAQVRTISHERHLIEERTGARVREFGQIFTLNPDVTGIAEEYGTEYAGVHLLVLGAIQMAGGGCACPESVLLKSLVRDLVVRRDDVVILDMEAGIEHLGRGSAMGVDVIVAVVEPGSRSLETAQRVRQMSRELGIERFGVILNKSLSSDDTNEVIMAFGDGVLIGVIGYDARLVKADQQGLSVVDLGEPELLVPFNDIKQKLKSFDKASRA